MFPTIQIDEKLCVGCGACVRDCLAKILTLESDVPAMVSDGASRCFRCQHCLAVCPTGAFSWNGRLADDSFPLGRAASPEETLNLLRQRRSIRQYKRENVSSQILADLRAAMDFVPTGCNDHRLFFACSDECEVTDSFRVAARESVLGMISSRTLPSRIVHFSKLQSALEQGVDIFFRNAPHFLAIAVPPEAKDAHIDPYIAASHFEVLASSFGLGTCWGGMATDLFQSDPALCERLQIPTTHELKIVMLFGIPAVKYARVPQPVSCVWHRVS